ncbi:MAG: type I-B CRISPR-associated protein Cas7/Cst2/DevR [Gammaproteobacteria bacterium]
MNLFGTVLTYPAPAANYRGESEQNRAVIQKITDGRFEYPVISPEAMRNALREMLAGYGLPCNRSRLHDEEQLAVKFTKYPYPEEYIDDFFFGYLVAADGNKRKTILNEVGKEKRPHPFHFKRDSVLRMNLARGLEPYRHDSLFTQSPKNIDSPWQNAGDSALLHRETAQTAFQYPFALNLNECQSKTFKRKTDSGEEEVNGLGFLLKAIGELNCVAGNHARSYYEMAPASIILRLSESLVAGYNTYGFSKDGGFPEVIEGIKKGDYPGNEFFIGGGLVKSMGDKDKQSLEQKNVTLDRSSQLLITTVGDKILRNRSTP